MKWISSAKGNPRQSGYYAIRLNYSKRPETAHWSAERGWSDGMRKLSYVEAWCELPEYKREKVG